MQKVQIIVRGAILLLLILIGFLGYYYWKLITPPTQVGADSGQGVSHIMTLYGYGNSDAEQLRTPDGIAVDEDGNIIVADSGHSRIMVFDRNGKFVLKFGKKGTKKTEMMFPLGVAAHKGRIYVVSMIQSKLQIYTNKGKLVREVLVDRPIRVKVHKEKLWITTPGQLWTTDLKGNVLRTYFRKGKAAGQLNYPNGIDFDSKDNVFLSDTMNNRIQIMNSKGNVIGAKGEPTKELNQKKRLFGLGMGLAVDDQDRIYVADAFSSAIKVFDHDGNSLADLGEEGSNDGQLDHPSDIVYMGGNRFAVADKQNDRVQILALSAPSKAGDPIPSGSSNVPYYFGAAALLIIGFTIWRVLRNRSAQEEPGSSF